MAASAILIRELRALSVGTLVVARGSPTVAPMSIVLASKSPMFASARPASSDLPPFFDMMIELMVLLQTVLQCYSVNIQ